MEPSYSSTNEALSDLEMFAVRLGALTPYTQEESKSVTSARQRIDYAARTLQHFKDQKLLPAIFPSFEYMGLTLRGLK